MKTVSMNDWVEFRLTEAGFEIFKDKMELKEYSNINFIDDIWKNQRAQLWQLFAIFGEYIKQSNALISWIVLEPDNKEGKDGNNL